MRCATPHRVLFLLAVASVVGTIGCRDADRGAGEDSARSPSEGIGYRASVPATTPYTAAIARLVFAGDIMAHPRNWNVADHDDLYEAVAHLVRRGDAGFANLETTVSDSRPYAGYPRFSVHSRYAEAAYRAGFSFLSLANNHTTDYGREGVIDTLEAVRRVAEREPGRYYGGIRSDQSSPFEPVVLVLSELRVVVVTLTNILNDWGGWELVDTLRSWNPSATDEVHERIRSAAQGADVVVVSIHHGTEYLTESVESEKRMLEGLADAGATVVWGHHPHVLQSPYYHTTPDGRRSLILPSLGNAISGQPRDVGFADFASPVAERGDSVLVEVVFHRDRLGRWTIATAHRHPITHFRTTDDTFVIRPLNETLTEPGQGSDAEARSAYYAYRAQVVAERMELRVSTPFAP